MRFRLGDIYKIADDTFWGRDLNNIILDHCSFTWAIDENGSWYDNSNFTMQWCLNAESLYHSYHPKGNHGYGGIWGGMGATFHHNLLADNSSRNPRFNGARYNSTYLTEKADYRNNVIFNWGFNSAYGGESGSYNMINNYYKPGPATSSGEKQYRIVNPSDAYGTAHYSKWYIDGNYVEGNSTVTADNWNGGVQPDSAPLDSIRLYSPLEVAPVTTESAQDAYNSVLANVGDNFPKRDSVDLRVINEVKTGNAPYGATYNGGNKGIIDSQTDVGGWPLLASTTPPLDSDHDGMPDDWETQHGLNPNDSTDSHTFATDGYTMIEEYINGLVSGNTTNVELSRNNIPDKFSISQNYPNPFNPSTVISFSLPESGNVEITIYNSIGQKVRELLNQNMESGSHNVQWNGRGFSNNVLASGVYIGVIKYHNNVKSIKMLLMK